MSGLINPPSYYFMTEDPEAFRQRVIKLAQELYPNLTLAEHPEALDVVLADEQQVSLQNIRANYTLSERPDDDLRFLVERHFGQLLSPAIPKIEDLTYDSIQDKLYPQVMPAEYVESAPLRLISFPLSNEVSVGLVADFPETYMYLREVDLQRWDVAADDLFDQAQKNLEELTQSVQLQLAGADKDVFVAVASGDGYDAVRILMPTFQAFLAQHLGETFRFAIQGKAEGNPILLDGVRRYYAITFGRRQPTAQQACSAAGRSQWRPQSEGQPGCRGSVAQGRDGASSSRR